MALSKNKKAETKTVPEEKGAVFIYVGPTTQAISRYTVYRGGYPPQLKEDLEKFPLLENLFINPKDLPAFMKNVNVPGSAEQVWFKEAQKYFAKRAVNEN